MKGIGSEFWLEHDIIECGNVQIPNWLNIGNDNKLLLSGRTALHFVLKDIRKSKNVTSVYFPKYSCQSMVQPFIDLGINIIYYNVYFENGLKFDINQNKKCDIFFAMNYFGFSEGRMDEFINVFKQRNITVIEDVTHSLLSKKQYNPKSDYMIASLRKWFPIISGGIASKSKGDFKVVKKDITFNKMIEIRKKAMIDKKAYMSENYSINKSAFLNNYSTANKMLSENYKEYNIDNHSAKILQELNINQIIYKRKKNAQLLIEKFLINKVFKLLFQEMSNTDCPIFIPVILDSKSRRDSFHEYLIDQKIYCPVHWPIPENIRNHGKINMFEQELSLIIDQRYDEYDMEYLIKKVEEFE